MDNDDDDGSDEDDDDDNDDCYDSAYCYDETRSMHINCNQELLYDVPSTLRTLSCIFKIGRLQPRWVLTYSNEDDW